jgi:hypothetical protein
MWGLLWWEVDVTTARVIGVSADTTPAADFAKLLASTTCNLLDPLDHGGAGGERPPAGFKTKIPLNFTFFAEKSRSDFTPVGLGPAFAISDVWPAQGGPSVNFKKFDKSLLALNLQGIPTMTTTFSALVCIIKKVAFVAVLAAVMAGLSTTAAFGQYPSRTVGGNSFGPPSGTSFRPGSYRPIFGSAIQHNPSTNSTYMPGVGVSKTSGFYRPIGNGYYRNPLNGNVYNPSTGSYTSGRKVTFKGGSYSPVWGSKIQHNASTNSTYMPGVGVVKRSGFYQPIGNGYYKNQRNGNVYNPSTGAYFSR